jgi:hypothetical protein
MTETLAIIGAVTGVTGSILALLSFSRDRAKIVVTHSRRTRASQAAGKWDFVRVFVANQGRQPIAITQAGLIEKRRLRLRERPAKAASVVVYAVSVALYRVGVSRWRLSRWHERVFGDWVGPFDTGRLWEALDEPVRLNLAELAQYDVPTPELRDGPADERQWTIYAYATDSSGRTVLSRFDVPIWELPPADQR